MTRFSILTVPLLMGGVVLARPVMAQVKRVAPPVALKAAVSQSRRTAFDPLKDGFRFANRFQNVVNLPLGTNIRTGGLCGGMAYTALDYFLAKSKIPQQDFLPAEGTPLQQYLYARQFTSLQSNTDKWAEVSLNPGGARDSEFFNWGLQGNNGGRIEELRSFIDRGMPVPIGLKSNSGGDHQVLAIGYDMGGYKGDLGANAANFKIFVYDSNHPLRMMTLVPDIANKVYKYPPGDNDGDNQNWRTYFVDKNYHAITPPNIPNSVYPNDGLVHEMVLAFATGNDDMRGGNDNLDLKINVFDGTQQNYPSVNLGKRWMSNYTQYAQIVLSHPVPLAQIKNLVLSDTFTGGVSGDNWDMASLDVRVIGGGLDRSVKQVGVHRFTGSEKQLTVTINDAPPSVAGQASRLVFEFRTGGDDLRGGNDNLNIQTAFTGGRTQSDDNVNQAAKWDNNTTHTVSITLNKPVAPDQIKSIVLSTTFGGGMGGDNWNMDWVKVTAQGKDLNKLIAQAPAKRFTGSDKQLVIPTSAK